MSCILYDLWWLHVPINLMWFSEQEDYQKLVKVSQLYAFLAKAAHKYTTFDAQLIKSAATFICVQKYRNINLPFLFTVGYGMGKNRQGTLSSELWAWLLPLINDRRWKIAKYM